MTYQIKGNLSVGGHLQIGRLSTSERTALSPSNPGVSVWDSDLDEMFLWDGSAWVAISVEDHTHAEFAWPRFSAGRHSDVTAQSNSGGNTTVQWSYSSIIDPGADFTVSGGDIGSGDTHFTGLVLPPSAVFEVHVDYALLIGGTDTDVRVGLVATGSPSATVGGDAYRWGPPGRASRRCGIGTRVWFVATGSAGNTVTVYNATWASGVTMEAGEGLLAARRIR